MSREQKISLIGARSLTFSPALLRGLCESELSKSTKLTISLLDIDSSILEKMYNVAQKIVEHYRKRGQESIHVTVEKTLDRMESFDNADFAIQTISVGGLKATLFNEEIPTRYGILQSVADTVGPGGFIRALRHIPTAVDIAKDLYEVSPKSILLNYSNPMTPITRAIHREIRIRAYGLCTSVYGFVVDLARLLGVELIEGWKITRALYEMFGVVPVPGDRHIAEFLPGIFMRKDAMERYEIPLFPKETVYSTEERADTATNRKCLVWEDAN